MPAVGPTGLASSLAGACSPILGAGPFSIGSLRGVQPAINMSPPKAHAIENRRCMEFTSLPAAGDQEPRPEAYHERQRRPGRDRRHAGANAADVEDPERTAQEQ